MKNDYFLGKMSMITLQERSLIPSEKTICVHLRPLSSPLPQFHREDDPGNIATFLCLRKCIFPNLGVEGRQCNQTHGGGADWGPGSTAVIVKQKSRRSSRRMGTSDSGGSGYVLHCLQLKTHTAQRAWLATYS